jgi:histidine ammonia-lyase
MSFLFKPESHRFCNRVQDAYTLRCCPQVHGIVHDTIDFVQGVITVEMNSGTDNPVSFVYGRYVPLISYHRINYKDRKTFHLRRNANSYFNDAII